MIDLHLHFDGSLPVSVVLELAAMQGIELPEYDEEKLKKYMQAPADCASLNEYLEKFELPLRLLQTEDAIRLAMIRVIEKLKAQGIIYAEIRFAPQLHCREGLSMERVTEAAMEGVRNAVRDRSISINLILCCMRGRDNKEANLDTVRIASGYLGNIVCACDLAGAEAVFKTEEFEEVFGLARELKVPFTIHAGEADTAESIKTAIRFGASRIGHGVHAIDDEETMQLIREKNITLECCPVSNVQTKAVSSIKEHPVGEFIKRGIKVTVNTDNMTVSGTTIANEFETIVNAGLISTEDKKQLLLNAAQAAFTTDEEKERLKNVITKAF